MSLKMKENYMLIIDYSVIHASGESSNRCEFFENLAKFWRSIETKYPDAISVEIESISIDW